MGINVVGASLINLLLFILYCPSETQMRGTVSICYGCLSVKCWARVVTSFPFPSWCMQRYPLNISMDSIDTTEFSLLMFVFEGKWYAPSPTTHTQAIYYPRSHTNSKCKSPTGPYSHTWAILSLQIKSLTSVQEILSLKELKAELPSEGFKYPTDQLIKKSWLNLFHLWQTVSKELI